MHKCMADRSRRGDVEKLRVRASKGSIHHVVSDIATSTTFLIQLP